MGGIAVRNLNNQIQNDPASLLVMIIRNNPTEVARNLQAFYGQTVSPNNEQGIVDAVVNLLEMYPQNANDIIEQIFSVDIAEDNLDEVQQEWVADRITQYRLRNSPPGELRTGGGGPVIDPDLGADATGAAGSSTGGSSAGGSSSFNWSEVLSGVLPGILSAFGIGGQQNAPSQSKPDPVKKTSDTWIWILIFIALIVVGFFALKK